MSQSRPVSVSKHSHADGYAGSPVATHFPPLKSHGMHVMSQRSPVIPCSQSQTPRGGPESDEAIQVLLTPHCGHGRLQASPTYPSLHAHVMTFTSSVVSRSVPLTPAPSRVTFWVTTSRLHFPKRHRGQGNSHCVPTQPSAQMQGPNSMPSSHTPFPLQIDSRSSSAKMSKYSRRKAISYLSPYTERYCMYASCSRRCHRRGWSGRGSLST
mmetsp:Transcript_6504/g.22430  ORF Transcript_6504/g.22430 Transcript_6504/m.22430 type:complete len:211 (+) Transcript_6504:767-1399(+)